MIVGEAPFFNWAAYVLIHCFFCSAQTNALIFFCLRTLKWISFWDFHCSTNCIFNQFIYKLQDRMTPTTNENWTPFHLLLQSLRWKCFALFFCLKSIQVKAMLFMKTISFFSSFELRKRGLDTYHLMDGKFQNLDYYGQIKKICTWWSYSSISSWQICAIAKSALKMFRTWFTGKKRKKTVS